MSTLTKVKKAGDLVVHMESLEYCLFPAIIRNGTGSTVALTEANMLGHFLKAGSSGADFDLAKSGEEGNVIAILLDGPPESKATANNYSGKYRVLKHPPAIINQSMLPAADAIGTAWDTLAEAVAALKVLGFEFRSDPVKQTIQTS